MATSALAKQWSEELQIARGEHVQGARLYPGVHCPKCWRGVRVNDADFVPAETAYLWGVVQVYSVSKTLDLRCRQCKGIRWRRTT